MIGAFKDTEEPEFTFTLLVGMKVFVPVWKIVWQLT